MGAGLYRKHFKQAADDPDGYWLEQAGRIEWFRPPTVGHQPGELGGQCWFADGELNTAWLALDAQVQSGRGDQPALIHDSPATGSQQVLTFSELTERVARMAGALAGLGVAKGDRVVIYMPMVPEAVIGMPAWAPFTRLCLAVLRPGNWHCESMMRGPRWCCRIPAESSLTG